MPLKPRAARGRSVAVAAGRVVVDGVWMLAVATVCRDLTNCEVDPEPPLVRTASAGLAHGHGRVVGVNDFGFQHAYFHGLDNRFQQVRRG